MRRGLRGLCNRRIVIERRLPALPVGIDRRRRATRRHRSRDGGDYAAHDNLLRARPSADRRDCPPSTASPCDAMRSDGRRTASLRTPGSILRYSDRRIATFAAHRVRARRRDRRHRFAFGPADQRASGHCQHPQARAVRRPPPDRGSPNRRSSTLEPSANRPNMMPTIHQMWLSL